MFNDVGNNVAQSLAVVPATLTGNGTTTKSSSTGHDRAGYGAIRVSWLVGNSADTLSGSLKFTFVAEHSDTPTDGDFVAVTDQNYLEETMVVAASGHVAVIDDPAEDQVIVKATYKGPKRYFRLNAVRTGNHASGTPMAATVDTFFPERSGASAVIGS